MRRSGCEKMKDDSLTKGIKCEGAMLKRYDTLDGIRTLAAIGIIMMHVKENSDYNIHGFFYNSVIPFFTNFVFLFMTLSCFSMCCGYYEKFDNNQITMSEFYEKRYKKIWPFFALLVIMDLLMNVSIASVIEAFANLTLVYGLLPNPKITVIGVGWTLGVIFVFYLLFPFFCFLLNTKKRAWFSMIIAILLNIVCTEYFYDINHMLKGASPRGNFVFCAMYFLSGGLLYLYREKIQRVVKKYKIIYLCMCFIVTISFFMCDYYIDSLQSNTNYISNILMLIVFNVWLCYAIGEDSRLLNNSITKFMAAISMEIYLCHMVIFRVIEKMKFLS